MAYSVSSQIFSINRMIDGTDVESFINGLTIETLHEVNFTPIGTATVMVSVVYE